MILNLYPPCFWQPMSVLTPPILLLSRIPRSPPAARMCSSVWPMADKSASPLAPAFVRCPTSQQRMPQPAMCWALRSGHAAFKVACLSPHSWYMKALTDSRWLSRCMWCDPTPAVWEHASFACAATNEKSQEETDHVAQSASVCRFTSGTPKLYKSWMPAIQMRRRPFTISSQAGCRYAARSATCTQCTSQKAHQQQKRLHCSEQRT